MSYYHQILGVTQNASKAEIKKAYRKLVLKYHPDRNPSKQAAQKFIEIDKAYDALMRGKPEYLLGDALVKKQQQANARKQAAEAIKRKQRERVKAQLRQKRQQKEQAWQQYTKLSVISLGLFLTLLFGAFIITFVKEWRNTSYYTNLLNKQGVETTGLIIYADAFWLETPEHNTFINARYNVAARFYVNNKEYKAYDLLKKKNENVITDYGIRVAENNTFKITYLKNKPSVNRIEWYKPTGQTLSDVLFNATIALLNQGVIQPNEMEVGFCIVDEVYKQVGFNGVVWCLTQKSKLNEEKQPNIEKLYNDCR